MPNINELPVHELLPLLQTRQLTARDLAEACIERITTREDKVGAWVQFCPDTVRKTADDLDSGPLRGLLHGIPVAVKDIIDTCDYPTERGSPIYAGRQPERDAACVAAVRRMGALIMGKTVTTEFAYFKPGKTANPKGLDHTPGGSSSGSAAAVADFMVPVAFGSQTAASLTRPAAYCGITGYKASWGQHALDGIQGLAPSLDSLGILSRSAEDAEIMRAALLDEPYRPLQLDIPRLKIGFCQTPDWASADATVAGAMEAARISLERAGAIVSPVILPEIFTNLSELHKLIMAYEARRMLEQEYLEHRELMSPQLYDLLDSGDRTSASDYQLAVTTTRKAKAEIAILLNDLDAIMAPSAPGEAPAGLGATGDPVFSRMWTLLQLPSVAVPVMNGPNGLPLGIQFIGRLGEDRNLLATARLFEQQTPA
ncbi:MAG: amidase [Rhodospirillales bacterium]